MMTFRYLEFKVWYPLGGAEAPPVEASDPPSCRFCSEPQNAHKAGGLIQLDAETLKQKLHDLDNEDLRQRLPKRKMSRPSCNHQLLSPLVVLKLASWLVYRLLESLTLGIGLVKAIDWRCPVWPTLMYLLRQAKKESITTILNVYFIGCPS